MKKFGFLTGNNFRHKAVKGGYVNICGWVSIVGDRVGGYDLRAYPGATVAGVHRSAVSPQERAEAESRATGRGCVVTASQVDAILRGTRAEKKAAGIWSADATS